MKILSLLPLLLTLLPLSAGAADLPDLRSQAAWGEKEKKEFIGFLKTSQPVPAGQVKAVAAGAVAGRGTPRKARYASLALETDTLVIDVGGGRSKRKLPRWAASCWWAATCSPGCAITPG